MSEAAQSPLVQLGVLPEPTVARLVNALRNDPVEYAEKGKEACVGNPLAFANIFLGEELHAHIVESYNKAKPYKKSVELLPRSHLKSSLRAIWEPSYKVAYAAVNWDGMEDPRVVVLQENDDEATKSMRAVQNYFETGGRRGALKAAFGDVKARAKASGIWRDDVIAFTTRTGGKDYIMKAQGVLSGFTGSHPFHLCSDDLATPRTSDSDTKRRNLEGAWKKTMPGAMEGNTVHRHVGTLKYPGDITQYFMGTKRYRVIKYEALNRMPEPDDFEELFDENDVMTWVRLTDKGKDLLALWPCPLGTGNCGPFYTEQDYDQHLAEYGGHRSVEYLLYDKYLDDPINFASEFMNRLEGEGGRRIKPDMFRFYSMQPDDIGKDPNDIIRRREWVFPSDPVVPFVKPGNVIDSGHAWDHAVGKTKKNSETSVTAGYRTPGNDVYYMVRAGQWGVSEVMGNRDTPGYMESWLGSDIVATSGGRKPRFIRSEGISGWRAYGEGVAGYSKNLLPMDVVTRASDKDAALVNSGLPGHMALGKVFFDVRDLNTIEQCINFTQDGKGRTDRVDSTRLCHEKLMEVATRRVRYHRARN